MGAGDTLQVGELFMIGRTIWQVTSRSGGAEGVYVPGAGDININMKMIETTTGDEASVIGAAGRRGLGYGILNNSTGVTSEGDTFDKDKGWCGPAFWPVTRYALGVVRNSRITDMTEIGIRSQVWIRAEGICNFNSLITPSELADYESDGISVQSGTMTQYMKRSSCFTISVSYTHLTLPTICSV